MVWRGLRRRCARCGAGAKFRRYFKLAERCWRCGCPFAREEGFFTGVYLINYALTAVLIVAVVMVYLFAAIGSDGSTSVVPFLITGGIIAVVVPIAFYPFAATTWAAIDLAMRPLDPVEEAEAAVWAEDPEWGRSGPPSPGLDRPA
jgi:uncharacterized protein (DUF983 family)